MIPKHYKGRGRWWQADQQRKAPPRDNPQPNRAPTGKRKRQWR
jgi:hypothetical protein